MARKRKETYRDRQTLPQPQALATAERLPAPTPGPIGPGCLPPDGSVYILSVRKGEANPMTKQKAPRDLVLRLRVGGCTPAEVDLVDDDNSELVTVTLDDFNDRFAPAITASRGPSSPPAAEPAGAREYGLQPFLTTALVQRALEAIDEHAGDDKPDFRVGSLMEWIDGLDHDTACALFDFLIDSGAIELIPEGARGQHRRAVVRKPLPVLLVELQSQAAPPVVEPVDPQSAIRNPQSEGHRPTPPRADLGFVSIADIDSSHNVRDHLDDEGLFQLGESIRDNSLLQPVIVRKLTPDEIKAGKGGKKGSEGRPFRLVAGHRRLEAARRAGETTIEAKVYAGEHVDDAWEARARLTENVQRTDLNHIELAKVYGQASRTGMSVAAIAAEAHRSDDDVRRHLSLLRLCEPVQRLVACGRLPVHQAELIARVGDFPRQIELTEETVKLEWDNKAGQWVDEQPPYWFKGKELAEWKAKQAAIPRDYVMPMTQLREAVGRAMQGLAGAGWPMDADYAGKRPCQGCPDNTLTYADQPTLFAGINPRGSDKKGFCTHAECYAIKTKLRETERAAARKERDAKQAEAVKKAKKAGLDVCVTCRKVAPAGDEFEAVGNLGKLCPACRQKEEKRQADYGRGRDHATPEGKAIAAWIEAVKVWAKKVTAAIFEQVDVADTAWMAEELVAQILPWNILLSAKGKPLMAELAAGLRVQWVDGKKPAKGTPLYQAIEAGYLDRDEERLPCFWAGYDSWRTAQANRDNATNALRQFIKDVKGQFPRLKFDAPPAYVAPGKESSEGSEGKTATAKGAKKKTARKKSGKAKK